MTSDLEETRMRNAQIYVFILVYFKILIIKRFPEGEDDSGINDTCFITNYRVNYEAISTDVKYQLN